MNIKKSTGYVCLFGVVPVFVIRKSVGEDINNFIHTHKTYWLFGIVPMFSTDSISYK